MTCINPFYLHPTPLNPLGIDEVVVTGVDPDGINYRFGEDGLFYFGNQDTGAWHRVEFVGDQFQIGAAVAVNPAYATAAAGDNYEFSATPLGFRLVDDAGLFRNFWAEGATGSDQLVADVTGSAADTGLVVSADTLFKIEDRLFYVWNTEANAWAVPWIVGAPGAEQFQLG